MKKKVIEYLVLFNLFYLKDIPLERIQRQTILFDLTINLLERKIIFHQSTNPFAVIVTDQCFSKECPGRGSVATAFLQGSMLHQKDI